MSNASNPIVVLVGPPGAGKSTIGRRLARALNTTLVDSDQLIEQATGKKCGEVFSELGEADFRELEVQFVAQALAHNGVVSLGGGAVISKATRERLANHHVVWIDISAEEGVRRTSEDQSRPILAAADPLERYQALLDQRRPFYEEVASFKVKNDSRGPQQLVAEILGNLESEVECLSPAHPYREA